MQLLDLSLPEAAANLALDEALLDGAERASESSSEGTDVEVLRFWESPTNAVVLGRSSRVEEEVDLEACQRLGVQVLRRCSGGASVMIGPGCLMYSVVLSHRRYPQLRMLDAAHQFVLRRMVTALRTLSPEVVQLGTSDLAESGKKFSGNSLRCKRDHLLYHGTLLYDFPLAQIERCLKTPPRQPEYRANRTHSQFITNLPFAADILREKIRGEWPIASTRTTWPQEETQHLLRTRYTQRRWTFVR